MTVAPIELQSGQDAVSPAPADDGFNSMVWPTVEPTLEQKIRAAAAETEKSFASLQALQVQAKALSEVPGQPVAGNPPPRAEDLAPTPGRVLSAQSGVDELRARLRVLNAPVYGTKYELWQRLVGREARVEAERQERQWLQLRTAQLASQQGQPEVKTKNT